MKRLIVAALVALGTAPLGAQPCWACTCVAYESPRQERHSHARRADVIFTGKTTSVEQSRDGQTLIAYFRVGKAHKGTHRERLVIKTQSEGSICGFHFKDDTRYTVFGKGEGPKVYSTNSCSGTKRGRIDPDRYGL